MSDARPTAKVLIVDADPTKLQALRAALTTAAYDVTSATSASFALTTLERDRPDLIVSGNRTEDMDGVEFCSIIRSDPTTHDIPFLLLSGPTRPTPWAVAQAGVDMLVAGDFVVSTVLDRISKLLRHVAPQADAGAAAAPASAAGDGTPRRGRDADFEGSFGVLDLTEVTQAIALGGKTGRLSLQLAAGEGSLFSSTPGASSTPSSPRAPGRAPSRPWSPPPSPTPRAPSASSRGDRELPAGSGPRTIQKSVDQLLLSIASDIDEGRAAASCCRPRAAEGD